jgi:hypothetical protein
LSSWYWPAGAMGGVAGGAAVSAAPAPCMKRVVKRKAAAPRQIGNGFARVVIDCLLVGALISFGLLLTTNDGGSYRHRQLSGLCRFRGACFVVMSVRARNPFDAEHLMRKWLI